VALGAGLGTLVCLGLLFGVLWALQALTWIGEGELPDLALTAECAVRALLLFDTWWPLTCGSDGAAERLLEAFEPPFWLVPLARLAPAFLFAAFWAGATRVYLLVRQEIDGIAVGQVED
jgi:hypothetical protein